MKKVIDFLEDHVRIDSRIAGKLMLYAIEEEDMDMILWLKDRGCEWESVHFKAAIETEDTDIIQLLIPEFPPETRPKAINDMVKHGNLETAKWLRDKGYTWDSDDVETATKYGNTPMVQWLITSGYPWDREKTILQAVHNDDTELADWLSTH